MIVSGKRAIRHTLVQTRTASSTFSGYRNYDQADLGHCSKYTATVGCIGYDAYYSSNVSLVAAGNVAVPTAVRLSTRVAQPQVRVTAHATHTYGTAMWGYAIGGTSSAGYPAVGSRTGAWLTYGGNPSSLLVSVGLGQYSYLFVDKFTITYHDLTLQ